MPQPASSRHGLLRRSEFVWFGYGGFHHHCAMPVQLREHWKRNTRRTFRLEAEKFIIDLTQFYYRYCNNSNSAVTGICLYGVFAVNGVFALSSTCAFRG